MALVARSKRKFDFMRIIENKLGPGEYEKEFFNNNNSNKKINNNIAFNSSKERILFENNNKNNSELGPGYYFKEYKNTFLRKSFSKDNIEEDIKDKKLYNISLFHLMNKKKYQFLKAKNSLIIDKNNSNQVNNNTKKELSYNKNNNDKSPKKYIKLIPTTLTKNRLNSIPSKEYYLGYYFDKNGIPLMVEESLIDKDKKSLMNLSKINKKDKYSITNYFNSCIIKRDKTKKDKMTNTTNYSCTNNDFMISNYSTNNSTNLLFNKAQQSQSSTDKSSNLISNNYINSVESYNSNNSYLLSNSSYDNMPSFNNNKSLSPKLMIKKKIKGNLYKIISKKINKKENKKIDVNNINNLSDSDIRDIVYNTLMGLEPGPGYYTNKSIFDKYQLLSKNHKKFNFGSNEKRTLNLLNKNTNKNLGPGTYFKKDNSKNVQKSFLSPFNKTHKIISKIYTKKLLDSPKKLDDFFSKTETSPDIGPGKYEFKSQFEKEQKPRSGPFEKRFFNIIKNNSLGPGEYLPLDNWDKNNNEIIYNQINNYKNKFMNNSNKDEGRDYFIPKSDNPEVGLYNPQIINSIEYNMIFHNNKISNLHAPFCTSENKFAHKYYSTPENVGPGSYLNNTNISKKNIINKEIKAKYNLLMKDIEKNKKIKALYDKNKNKIKNRIGPGTYGNFNYYDWNKRSFNILYV